MLGRNKTQKDIRSKIRHENTQLGGGTQMGGVPNNYGLHNNAFQVRQQQQQQAASSPVYDQDYYQQPSSSSSIGSPMSGFLPISSPARQNVPLPGQQDRPYTASGAASTSNARPGQADGQRLHPGVASAMAQDMGSAATSSHALAPGDSASNYEGRPGLLSRGSSFQDAHALEPSAASTASFAQGLATASTSQSPEKQATAMPSRPARSGRRPRGVASPPADAPSQFLPEGEAPAPVGRNLLGSARARGQASASSSHEPDAANFVDGNDRHARAARMLNSANQGDVDGEESDDEDRDDGDPRPAINGRSAKRYLEPMASPPLGSLTRSEQPAALNKVLSALSQAGRRQGQTRILRGVTAEEESRRRRVERKMGAAQSHVSKPLKSYIDPQDEPAFRDICGVLRKAKAEWDFLVGDDFNPVSLALSLMDESSLGSNVREFDEIKDMIETSLQGTVDDHYESFATAIGLHSNVLSSLTAAQGGVSGARKRLRDAREALGAKRADLVQLWQRSQAVKDSLQLLDTVDHLKGIPDRLESLMAEKQFLEAVKLLNRALRVCAKPEMLEIGAAADLRSYLRGQEQAMFDILIEELHNHLYLKSFFCDARWKAYTQGQTSLPNVDFGQDYEEYTDQLKRQREQTTRSRRNALIHDMSSMDAAQPYTIDGEENGANSSDPARRGQESSLKLHKFLKSLDDRPQSDLSDDNVLDLAPEGWTGHGADGTGITASGSVDSLAGQTAPKASTMQQHNPETDSFLYIEMLLEALARLGKLRAAQDIVLQRLPTELHQLVDATIDEVEMRSDVARRSSAAILRPESHLLSSSSALARSFAESTRDSFKGSLTGVPGGRGSINGTGTSWTTFGVMRVSTLETSQVERDAETMRDLFWTLFSKLDAVLQGHRVVYEVMTRICSRGASSVYKTVKLGKPAELTDVWRPIQAEVRSLFFEHLADDSNSSSARRNAVMSVNEALRQGSFHRDRSKALFRLMTDSAPRPGANLSRRDFAPLRRHEESLSSALRESVPGLVGAAGEGPHAGAFQHLQQNKSVLAMSFGSSSLEGYGETGTHKLLVKPDAFNISVLFQPALEFIERVKMLLPPEAAGRMNEVETDVSIGSDRSNRGFGRFLDEFVRDVFLSQLEDKVQSLFATAVGGPDAFQEDSVFKAQSQGKPIVRSASNVLVLIDSLYSMLRTTPFHRESYSLLVIQTIVQYHQRCHERFRDLVTSESAPVLPARVRGSIANPPAPTIGTPVLTSVWAQRPEIFACLSEAVQEDVTPERYDELLDLENALESKLAFSSQSDASSQSGLGSPKSPTSADGTAAITLHDITTSRKKLLALGNLHNSLLWLHDRISKLKATSGPVPTSSNARARLSLTDEQFASLRATDAEEAGQDIQGLKLPLSASMAARFETLPGTYRHLANVVLFTLRLEVRARAIRYLDLAINEGNYLVEDAVLEPDPHIVDLNSELASIDEIFSDTLQLQYHAFVFAGLASLMDLHLCRAIRKVRFINRNGLTKMIRNILALQQNLRNIVVVHDSMRKAVAGDSGSILPGDGVEAQKAALKSARLTAMYVDRGASFERSRRMWELVGKEPEGLLAAIRASDVKHSFDEYHSALNLMLGLENVSGSQQQQHSLSSAGGAMSSTVASAEQGPLPPGASLRPGTSDMPREHSRQKINEYLIELHEIAGEAL